METLKKNFFLLVPINTYYCAMIKSCIRLVTGSVSDIDTKRYVTITYKYIYIYRIYKKELIASEHHIRLKIEEFIPLLYFRRNDNLLFKTGN